ncbi:RidA family protein [Leptolyngbya sp. CCY15150]|uniref:RidA family protein n=1 Tax=Leptolyngbya sp. CCY15150 TaxID=2767772 RepID=UPI00194FB620|nr:RidA family protein [Leptolyngbya sp. CCY15150]
MRKFVMHGDGLPQWSSPISHAVVVDNICYLSGQLSINESGDYIPGTVRDEAERAFSNLFAALRAADFSVDDLTFIDIAFIDLNDVAEVNKLYADLFPEDRRPARTIYQAAALPFGGRVKVMGVAIKERSLDS